MGRPPKHANPAAKQRAYRERQREQSRTKAAQRAERIDAALATLAQPLPPPVAPPTEFYSAPDEPPRWTFSRRRQLLNLLHLHMHPAQVVPWLADRLAADAPPAQREALERALNDLARALDLLDHTNLKPMRVN